MTKYTHEIEIEAPIEYVFEWGTVPENWKRIDTTLDDIELVEETDEGRRYRTTMKMLGRSMTSEQLYTVDEANRQSTSVFEGDLNGEMRYSHSETGSGTKVRLDADFEAGRSLFERALRPVFTRYTNRQFRNSFRTMKELIEVEIDQDEGKYAGEAVAEIGK